MAAIKSGPLDLSEPPDAKRMRTTQENEDRRDGPEPLAQGAEGRVVITTLLGKRVVCKYRFRKAYRHPDLDARLNAKRLSQEVRMMLRARQLGVRTPTIYHVDARANAIYMEFLEEKNGWMPVRQLLRQREAEFFRDGDDDSEAHPDLLAIGARLGGLAAALHDGGVIHGDLTTSNVMLRRRDEDEARDHDNASSHFEFALIDFGLSVVCTKLGDEERAVDLYVLERAIESAHNKLAATLRGAMLSQYAAAWTDETKGARVLRRLEEVRQRGRKRDMTG